MTLITLPSGTVLANDFALPIIVVSKVLMANDNNPHAKLYPYYFTIMYPISIRHTSIFVTSSVTQRPLVRLVIVNPS